MVKLTFTVETVVEELPVEEVQAVVAVDGSGTDEGLLGEGVAVIIYDRLLDVPHVCPSCNKPRKSRQF